MTDDTSNPLPATDLAGLLAPALLRLVRQFRAGIQASGLPPAQAMLLKRLQSHPGLGVSELAEMERVRRPTISGHIKELEAAGLIERLPPPAGDRRRIGLRVTAAGQALIDSVFAQWTGWIAARIEELPEPGRDALVQALPHLSAMSAHPDEAP